MPSDETKAIRAEIEILSTASDIRNDDVGREISDCLDNFAEDRRSGDAVVRLLAVIAGSLQRISETLEDISLEGVPGDKIRRR